MFSKKRDDSEDFFIINKDFTFSNSLLKIDFYFSNLLWVHFPNVGKKYYNGSVSLNAERIEFPFVITVKLSKGIKKYVVEKNEDGLTLNSDNYKIDYFNSFKIFYLRKEMPRRITCLINNRFYFNKPKSSISVATKIKDINFKNFNKTDFL